MAKASPKRNDACKRLEFGDVVARESSPPENEMEKKMLETCSKWQGKTHNQLKVDKQDTALLRSVQQMRATLGNTSVANERNSDNPAKKPKPQG